MPAKDGLISSYFGRSSNASPAAPAPTVLGVRAAGENGEGRPAKQARVQSPNSGGKAVVGSAGLQQWSFDRNAALAAGGVPHGDSNNGEPAAIPATQPQRTAAQEERHAAFKARLLGAQKDEGGQARQSPEAQVIDDSDEEGEEGQGEETDEHLARFAATTEPARPKARSGAKAVETSDGIKYTPLERQYLDLRKTYPDVLLCIEVGYKFKFYGDDAQVASRELNIACFMEKHLWTAMVPLHRLQLHIKKLVQAGHKVGVVRQTETRALKAASSNASKPFARQLTELYTASTWIDDMAETAANNGSNSTSPRSLVALVEQGEDADERVSIGIVAIQAATGTITYDEFMDGSMRSELETRLAHLEPAELVVPKDTSKPTRRLLRYIAGQSSISSIRIEETDTAPSYNEALTAVSDFYAKSEHVYEDGTGNQGDPGKVMSVVLALPRLALVALAMSIGHLTAFHLESVFRLATNFASFESRHEMLLTGNTLSNLEVLQNNTDQQERGSLIWMLGAGCTTAMGKRLLRRWLTRPLTDVAKLRHRADAVESLVTQRHINTRASSLLKGLPDLERGLARLNYGRAAPTELATILLSLHRVTTEFEPGQYAASLGSPLLDEAIAALPTGRGVIQDALAAISIAKARDNCKQDLFTDVNRYPFVQDTKDLLSVVECDLHEHLLELRKTVRNPRLKYASVAGEDYLVEVAKDTRLAIPADWLRISSTKKFVRYRSPTVIRLMKQRDQCQETLDAQAGQAYRSFVRDFCDQHYAVLRSIVTSLATLDALISLATLGNLPGYSKASFVVEQGNCIDLRGFRHPMTEALQESGTYVANDICLGDAAPDKAKAVLLTGSNMGGKSSTVRAVALVIIMAQVGSYVPATHACLSLHDAVLTRMGASDQLAKGRSTFMVEVQETAEIMRTATSSSLVILDELGRGTSTHDGQAIAEAVLQHLLDREVHRRPMLFFVTHFLALGQLMEVLPLRGMHMAYHDRGNGDISFLYKMRNGLAEKSFGIHCARLAALPESLLVLASAKASELEVHTAERAVQQRHARAAQLARLLFSPLEWTPDRLSQVQTAAAVLGVRL